MNSDELRSLWWSMQQGSYGSRKAGIITCYLDESGTDDHSPTAVVGGVVLDRRGFLAFDRAWRAALNKHRIPHIHIKSFRRHHEFGAFTSEQREGIFFDAAKVINQYKLISLGATLTTAQYRRHFAGLMGKDVMSFYGACFLLAVVISHGVAKNSNHGKRIPFLMDAGNPHADHVREAHQSTLKFQKDTFLNMGSLTFADDKDVLPLQAADAVSWAVRRRLTKEFAKGFEPLQNIFDKHHVEYEFADQYMAELASNLRARLES